MISDVHITNSLGYPLSNVYITEVPLLSSPDLQSLSIRLTLLYNVSCANHSLEVVTTPLVVGRPVIAFQSAEPPCAGDSMSLLCDSPW